ncbi:hypothetical protein, unlikely [Trypanosoma brucei gambiense DAL972]|uniref:Uncharacterized protein n=1 Tax=Trypanosoma brucei gambiense (strain MHOM/CI/86/DAL972) TaxID=679716 RepID=D0A628_TRYB9|nr:hypothetical protein, unlikely [Trypanosoma brucei gambiense DAL972]CBH17129.1 hypothetical protein, unlikely [Trypanosoma brucei gambiense DAL972]|eukprot:XP_011779393.1 hypothetical protein, unlikely [Trypanosoma brucei gambiense DAL972]
MSVCVWGGGGGGGVCTTTQITSSTSRAVDKEILTAAAYSSEFVLSPCFIILYQTFVDTKWNKIIKQGKERKNTRGTMFRMFLFSSFLFLRCCWPFSLCNFPPYSALFLHSAAP